MNTSLKVISYVARLRTKRKEELNTFRKTNSTAALGVKTVQDRDILKYRRRRKKEGSIPEVGDDFPLLGIVARKNLIQWHANKKGAESTCASTQSD